MLESEYERADLDNAALRLSSSGRFANGLFGLFGDGFRRNLRQNLREEGYDGD